MSTILIPYLLLIRTSKIVTNVHMCAGPARSVWLLEHHRHCPVWLLEHHRHSSVWLLEHHRHCSVWLLEHHRHRSVWLLEHHRHSSVWLLEHHRHGSVWLLIIKCDRLILHTMIEPDEDIVTVILFSHLSSFFLLYYIIINGHKLCPFKGRV